MWFKRLAKLEKFQEWTWKFLAALPTLGLILFQHNAQLRHGIDTFPFTQDQFWYGWELWISTLGLILLLHRNCQRPNATKFRRPQIKHMFIQLQLVKMIFLFLPHVCSSSIEKKSVGFVPINYIYGFWPCFSVKVIKKIESKSMHHTNDSGPGPRQPLLPQRCTVLIRYAAVQKQMKTYNIFLHKLHKYTQSLTSTKKIQKGTINRSYASNVPVVLALKQRLAYTGMFFCKQFLKKSDCWLFSVNSNRRKFKFDWKI